MQNHGQDAHPRPPSGDRNLRADNRHCWPAALVAALLGVGLAVSGISSANAVGENADENMTETLLIDDFSRSDGISALGTRWEGFTDRVMGGRSDMQLDYRQADSGPVLHMRGQVRLENRGGFIQARLPLDPRGGAFDASAWKGIGIMVRGQPGAYYIHLRTRQNWMPWQYFRARIAVGEDWQEQLVLFDDFEGVSTRRGLDVTALKSLAVVAYGEAFEADIEVARIELLAP